MGGGCRCDATTASIAGEHGESDWPHAGVLDATERLVVGHLRSDGSRVEVCGDDSVLFCKNKRWR